MDGLVWMVILCLAASILFFVGGISWAWRLRRKMNYMLDALEDNEVNFRFREDRFWDRRVNRLLNRLRTFFEKERSVLREQETYYVRVLDSVGSGIVVFDRVSSGILYVNEAGLSLLGISSLVNLRQLNNVSSELYAAFSRVVHSGEEKVAFVSNMSNRSLSLKASSCKVSGKDVCIVSFDDISRTKAEIELESWSKLIRVLTHEIMNTVTPIASLSDTLLKGMDAVDQGASASQSPISQSPIPMSSHDFRSALETISDSAKGLIRFTGLYRQLLRVPEPVRKAVWFKDIVQRVNHLMAAELKESGVCFQYEEKSEDIMIYADQDQISQILVNLERNAIQAGATRIKVTSRIGQDGCVTVDVENNGSPIEEGSEQEIFVPFYTTKPSGSGIGLSLSRQMMRKHNGNLILSRSSGNSTVFTLIFG